ncbi:MAG TPA: 30S ribosomal protein S8 [Candidatus Paceibacterota bacterium]|nr:30S ribosomal protein S8 [Candidatus Paceibacterota bacterium]
MDQIANMINMIKNASRVGHELIVVPHSKMKFLIAECLVKEGYLKSVTKKTKKGFPVIELGLVYAEDGTPKVTGADRVSKSSCRVYKGVKDIRKSYGLTLLSTPKGILTDQQARKEMVGGEVLFKLW